MTPASEPSSGTEERPGEAAVPSAGGTVAEGAAPADWAPAFVLPSRTEIAKGAAADMAALLPLGGAAAAGVLAVPDGWLPLPPGEAMPLAMACAVALAAHGARLAADAVTPLAAIHWSRIHSALAFSLGSALLLAPGSSSPVAEGFVLALATFTLVVAVQIAQSRTFAKGFVLAVCLLVLPHVMHAGAPGILLDGGAWRAPAAHPPPGLAPPVR